MNACLLYTSKAAVNHALLDDLCAYGMDQIENALDTPDKNVREERLTAARVDFANHFAEKYEDFEDNIEVCLYKMQKKVVKKWLLAGKRVDGRGMDEIRPLAAEVGVLPRVHGSGLFTRGPVSYTHLGAGLLGREHDLSFWHNKMHRQRV